VGHFLRRKIWLFDQRSVIQQKKIKINRSKKPYETRINKDLKIKFEMTIVNLSEVWPLLAKHFQNSE
jgi:hypothetical protein